jgi:glycyl-tRNA synthetase alpha chain
LTQNNSNPLTYQELILRLQSFWAEQGCVLQQPYDVEVGAGTMAPETFLRVLGPNPYKVAYVQPSRRTADGRYGENPNRLYKHMQRQVMLDGLEITQFTYFQQCGGVDLDPICAELTYGLERIAAFLQDVNSIYDIVWARDPRTGRPFTYGDVRLADELQFSVYNFEMADVDKAWKHFELYEAECKELLDQYGAMSSDEKDPRPVSPNDGETRTGHPDKKRFPLLAAYDLCLKCSHLFNILDARGAISVTERVGVIARVRALAVGIAKAWVNQQSEDATSSEEEEPAGTRRPKANKNKNKEENLSPVG